MEPEVEIMRVVRVPPMGQLRVAIGDTRHEQLESIADPGERQRALAAIAELVVFAGGYDKLVQAGLAPPAVAPAGAPPPAAASLPAASGE
ncbi:MAG: hypothetical protein ACRDHL_03475, partial [Candidatus Promineifilaceae bacterium]